MERGVWSEQEHMRFLQAIRYYPEGPWAKIAGCIGTRSARQVQTHAQRYYEKVQRHVRGLQRDRSKSTHKEHRIDENILRLQRLHRAAKAPAKTSAVVGASAPAEATQEEPAKRLYRSKDPPPCLQRLAGLPPQQSPGGRQEKDVESPRFGVPLGYYNQARQQHSVHPISPLYDQSKVIPHGLPYPQHDPRSMGYAYPLPPPSPHHHQQQQKRYPSMPLLPPLTSKMTESPYHGSAFGGSNLFPVSSPSSIGQASPHDSQVISSTIRSVDDPSTPRLPSVGRPTLSWSQPNLLLPRLSRDLYG